MSKAMKIACIRQSFRKERNIVRQIVDDLVCGVEAKAVIDKRALRMLEKSVEVRNRIKWNLKVRPLTRDPLTVRLYKVRRCILFACSYYSFLVLGDDRATDDLCPV